MHNVILSMGDRHTNFKTDSVKSHRENTVCSFTCWCSCGLEIIQGNQNCTNVQSSVGAEQSLKGFTFSLRVKANSCMDELSTSNTHHNSHFHVSETCNIMVNLRVKDMAWRVLYIGNTFDEWINETKYKYNFFPPRSKYKDT